MVLSIILILYLTNPGDMNCYCTMFNCSIHEYEIDLSEGTVLTSSCICPGYEAVFNCTADGGTATIWRGTALKNCSDGSIILRHSQFDTGYLINETCGTSGQVVGQAKSTENGSYTSQLTINITQQVIGRHIICATDGEINGSVQIMPSTGTQEYLLHDHDNAHFLAWT